MERITSHQVSDLMEAYASVYSPQEEITEEQIKEDFENWVNQLVGEGHDLSEYTWEEMYEHYLNEAPQSGLSIGPGGFQIGGRPVQSGQTRMSPIFQRPGARPAAPQRGLSVGKGGFQINGRPVQPGMSPIFQRPGARPAAPARPSAAPAARPATQAQQRPAAAARPAAQPSRGATAAPKPAASSTTSYTGATGVKPVGTSIGTPTMLSTQAKTPNPLMQRTFGYQTGQAPSQVAAQQTAAQRTATAFAPSTPNLAARTAAPAKRTAPTRAAILQQDFDVFDVIKGHLLDEGYADSEESALQIMANMSEEWRSNIIEQTARIDYVRDKFDKENAKRSGSAHAEIPGKQNTGQALYKAIQSARSMGKLEGV
jgi:hypothetical protein